MAFLTLIPAPYQIDLFDAIARHPRLSPRVYYYAAAAPNTRWPTPTLPAYSEILPGVRLNALTRGCCWNPSAVRRLRRESADLVVVCDYFTLTAQHVMRDLTRRRAPWVFWGETPGLHRRSRLGRGLRRLAQRPILRGARAIVGIGSAAQRAYRELLGDDRPVFNVPYHCDLSRYLAIRRDPAAATQPIRFLYSGQMIDRKGVDVLLRAFVALSRGIEGAAKAPRLTLLGDGPRRARYEAMVPTDLRDRVDFRGFRAPADLPAAFADADVFVLPSRHDGWGVVVNEAIGAGMPVIATQAVGAACDLVEEGRNGYRVAVDDAAALARAMRRFVDDPASVGVFGRRSREIATDYTANRGAERWAEVCEELRVPWCE